MFDVFILYSFKPCPISLGSNHDDLEPTGDINCAQHSGGSGAHMFYTHAYIDQGYTIQRHPGSLVSNASFRNEK